MLYDHSIGVAYLGFHTLLYFEHRVFLALECSAITTRAHKKPKQGDQREKYCLISKQYNIGRISRIKHIIVLDKMLSYAEAIADVIYKGFY